MSCPTCYGRGTCQGCSGLGDVLDSDDRLVICEVCAGRCICGTCYGETYTRQTYHDERHQMITCWLHGPQAQSAPYFYAKGIPCAWCAEERDQARR